MATTMIYTPNILSLPYISPLDEQLYLPKVIIADSSKFTEEETINFLTAHIYDPDFQITHPEHKKLKLLKLFDFIPQGLKSLDNYLQAIYPFINSPVLSDYLSENIIPVPADYPGQYYLCKAITLQRRYGDSSNIPEKILHLVPLLEKKSSKETSTMDDRSFALLCSLWMDDH
nr:15091_t:CDS:2 [Entrophospora candida]